jgi:protein disulfide-isomerase
LRPAVRIRPPGADPVLSVCSPYCPHCIEFAPTFQTLYEFYYTSKPNPSNPDLTFTKHYDFHFAEINCVAFYDLCAAHGVQSYPTTILFKNGEAVDKVKGGKNITALSDVVEEALEKDNPGSRPKKILLPKPKDKTSPKPEKAAGAAAPAHSTDVKALSKNGKDSSHKSHAAKKPSKPKATPNEEGISTSLTAESFQKLVTMTQEPWFIKFYAPWCHHCQAMAPNWQQLAKEMKGRLNIGEVNCDQESRLCKDVRLRGYPTVLFFKGGERVEYDGLRGLGDFVQYAEKAIDISSGIQDVDATSLKALQQKEDVIFVYFYDHATTSEDFMALERIPLSLIGHAKLVKTKDPALCDRFKITTWPRLLASREGRPTYYNPLTPKEMRDVHGILNWMKSVWLPIIPELTASNAREIFDGKIVVLGILNREDQESFLSAKREMKSAANEWMDKQIQLFQLERQELRDAKQLRIEEAEDRNDQRALRQAKAIRINMDRSDRKEVAFAWVDGVFWQRWIRTTYGIDVKDGERVIINDEDVSSPAGNAYRDDILKLNEPTEPTLLGHHHDWKLHPPVADLDPGDHLEGRHFASQDQAQTYHLELREDLLRHARHLFRASLPHRRLHPRSLLGRGFLVPWQDSETGRPLPPGR